MYFVTLYISWECTHFVEYRLFTVYTVQWTLRIFNSNAYISWDRLNWRTRAHWGGEGRGGSLRYELIFHICIVFIIPQHRKLLSSRVELILFLIHALFWWDEIISEKRVWGEIIIVGYPSETPFHRRPHLPLHRRPQCSHRRPHFIRDPSCRFIGDPYIFIGDPNILMETPTFSSETPIFS